MKIKFGENLKALRADRNLRQADLAKVLGTTQRRISYLETGKIQPDLETLWALAEYFDISVDELIGKSGY